MKQYKDLVNKVIREGELSLDRTGTGTRRIFGETMTFDVSRKFPLVTLKKTHWNSIIHELIWFLKGDTNTKYLRDNGVTIWDEWATETGDLGPIYGAQWRNAGGRFRHWALGGVVTQDGVDQLEQAIELIKKNPYSRRIIVDSWEPRFLPDESISPQENVGLGKMALAPCHMMFQFFVRSDGHLDLQMYQRSVDVFLGLPFNIASYAALLYIIAKLTGKRPGILKWVGGDIHLYNNHYQQALTMLKRTPLELPRLAILGDFKTIDDIEAHHFQLEDYVAHPYIKGEISV